MSLMSNTSGAIDPETSFNNLYYATVKCCVVIFGGYIAGRVGLITTTQASGIGTFVSKFALPALLFVNMCELEFEQVNWMFMCGIFISKLVIFLLVVIVSVLIKRPVNWGMAGIFAIFCTQSNDFGYGYPIMEALYKNSNPEYLRYIYLIAPISLVILNPIGFIMLEYNNETLKRKRSGRLMIIFRIFKGIVLNPIVTMTIVGIIGNFIFSHRVPLILKEILDVLGAAFIGCALFFLGLSLVGKVKSQLGMSLILPAILITAKLLVMPLIMWQVTMMLTSDLPNNQSQSYSMFAFFYGTIPTAPTVFLYASMYDCFTDIVATGMVICTFIAAPLMLVSAKMMSLSVVSQDDYMKLLVDVAFNVCIASLVFCVWIVVVFLITGRWKRMPHKFTLCLVISQFTASIGMILYKFVDQANIWQTTVQETVLIAGVYCGRCSTATIAVALYLLRRCGVAYVHHNKVWLIFYSFGFPIIITGILIGAGHHSSADVEPGFHFGNDQTITSAIILTLNLVMTIVALILVYRHDNQESRRSDAHFERSATRCDSVDDHESSIDRTPRSGVQSKGACGHSLTLDDVTIERHDDVLINEDRLLIPQFTDEYDEISIHDPHTDTKEELQIGRHVVLLILLSIAMIVGIFLCLWRLCTHKTSGIYIEIEFLDTVLQHGQSFFVFAVFGLESQLVIIPFVKKMRRWVYGVEIVPITPEDELPARVKLTRDQFRNCHIDSCRRMIVKQHRYMGRLYRDVFVGPDLIDWLVEAGVVSDRMEGVSYGRRLLVSGVVQHVKNEHHFHDSRLFYRFLDDDPLSD